ncbi:MarR family winged helix-turn-helix transcriptional regulator [Thermomonospora umbrina]|uniref:MarR family transcriptional regulator n=1 Tax=Thermomonospora umbrina TaxID=111806 RepID=A0A3D9SN92_9ACTN|nr:MarR family transcriptional regulator [Thermomonospora umbrina]REE95900.1 MarR family transcriptional regulator [Thermomonospora umbrina]
MTTASTLLSPAELEVWRTLLRAQARISRRLQTDLLDGHDLALGCYDVLMHLGESPGGRLRMNDLADRVLLSRSGLTRLVDRLQRDGLVERESCASDARGLFAVLTAEGRARLEEATPTYRRAVRECVVSRLGPGELRRFGDILGRLAGDADTPAVPAQRPREA